MVDKISTLEAQYLQCCSLQRATITQCLSIERSSQLWPEIHHCSLFTGDWSSEEYDIVCMLCVVMVCWQASMHAARCIRYR